MTDERRRQPAHAGATRGAILAVLQAAGRPVGIDELADAVRRHPNSVREQVQQLVAAGLAGRAKAPAAGRGRPAYRYAATTPAGGDGEDGSGYRSLAAVLADQMALAPDAAAASIRAGERWGSALAGGTAAGTLAASADAATTSADAATTSDVTPDGAATSSVARLLDILDEAGFAPERPGDPSGPLRLHRCPFEPVARAQPGVVCGIHLGMIRGALRTMGAGIDVVSLEPFVTHDTCLAHLAPATGWDPRRDP